MPAFGSSEQHNNMVQLAERDGEQRVPGDFVGLYLMFESSVRGDKVRPGWRAGLCAFYPIPGMNADHDRMGLDQGEVPVHWIGRVSICVLIGLVVGPMIGTVLTGPGEGGLVGFIYGLFIGPLVGALLGLAWGVLGQKRAGLPLHSLGRVCTLVLVGLVLALAVGKYMSVHQGVAGFNGLGKWFWLGPGLGALLGVIWSLRSWGKADLSDSMRHTQ